MEKKAYRIKKTGTKMLAIVDDAEHLLVVYLKQTYDDELGYKFLIVISFLINSKTGAKQNGY